MGDSGVDVQRSKAVLKYIRFQTEGEDRGKSNGFALLDLNAFN